MVIDKLLLCLYLIYGNRLFDRPGGATVPGEHRCK